MTSDMRERGACVADRAERVLKLDELRGALLEPIESKTNTSDRAPQIVQSNLVLWMFLHGAPARECLARHPHELRPRFGGFERRQRAQPGESIEESSIVQQGNKLAVSSDAFSTQLCLEGGRRLVAEVNIEIADARRGIAENAKLFLGCRLVCQLRPHAKSSERNAEAADCVRIDTGAHFRDRCDHAIEPGIELVQRALAGLYVAHSIVRMEQRPVHFDAHRVAWLDDTCG
jgi:hypothetical protein